MFPNFVRPGQNLKSVEMGRKSVGIANGLAVESRRLSFSGMNLFKAGEELMI